MEAVDLQVDYWMIPPKMEATEKLDRSAKKEVKCSLKTMFRSMQVFRPQSASTVLPQQPLQQPLPPHTSSSLSSSPLDSASLPGLSMIVVTREKKQKSQYLPCHGWSGVLSRKKVREGEVWQEKVGLVSLFVNYWIPQSMLVVLSGLEDLLSEHKYDSSYPVT